MGWELSSTTKKFPVFNAAEFVVGIAVPWSSTFYMEVDD
jgi:hypothetical protein